MRFRTIPVNELIYGVTITPLCVCRVEAIQHAALRGQVGQPKNRFGATALSSELGFNFLTGGLSATAQLIRVVPRLQGEELPVIRPEAQTITWSA